MQNIALPSVPKSGIFREFLQNEFERRCRLNPQYSLRAFARFLGLEPSYLSKVMRGQRSVTPKLLHKIGSKIGLQKAELETLPESSRIYQSLDVSQFQVVADWQHYAILELMNVKGFVPDCCWIAQKLGISLADAEHSVERLIKVGLIRVAPDDSWIAQANTTANNPFSALAFRQLQKQILSQAIEAMEKTPIEERDQTSMTFAMDRELMDEAKRRLRSFRRELIEFLETNSKNRDRVYQFSLSMFPVSDLEGALS